MNFKKKLEQYGLPQVLKTYFHSGLILYAILFFFFIKKDKKGLELFRNILNNKLYLKLYKKNRRLIKHFERKEFEKGDGIPKIIWFCWFQGIENAPALVKKCYILLQKNLKEYKIFNITEKNFCDYTDIPDFIIDKWKKGVITYTHFSDILRNNLLINNGGYWIDSTVFISGNIPELIQKSSFFLFQTYKPGCNGTRVNISSWFIASVKNNPVLILAQNLLFNYWKRKNYLIDYFLYHNFLQMSLYYYRDIYDSIPKYTNETTHFLLFELQKKFNENIFNDICSQTFAHKLTYKLPEDFDKTKRDTFYYHFVNDYK